MPLFSTKILRNDHFFLEHARPGMLGFMAADAPMRPLPGLIRRFTGSLLLGGTGEPSLWSHAFLVTERREGEDGSTEIHIVESTLIPPHHRLPEAGPGSPDWDGPQTSVLVGRAACGTIHGQPERIESRRYIVDEYTPNVALFDLRLEGERLEEMLAHARQQVVAERCYGSLELLGIVLGALDGDTNEPIALDDQDDVFCSAFLREILAPFVPAIDAIPHDVSHTTCEHLYRAVLDEFHGLAIVRQGRMPEPEGPDVVELAERLAERFQAAAARRRGGGSGAPG